MISDKYIVALGDDVKYQGTVKVWNLKETIAEYADHKDGIFKDSSLALPSPLDYQYDIIGDESQVFIFGSMMVFKFIYISCVFLFT